jgi:hypothetical protein
MRLPDDHIAFEGRVIPAEKVEETGDENQTTALYRDKAGKWYAVFHNSKRSWEQALRMYFEETGERSVPFPNRAAQDRIDELSEISIRTVRLSERGALAWYHREFVNDGPLNKLMREAIAAFVPKAERQGKVQLTAWVKRAVAAQFQRCAHAAGITEQELLASFIEDGLQRARTPRKGSPIPTARKATREELKELARAYRAGEPLSDEQWSWIAELIGNPPAARAKSTAPAGAHVQLELATSLVAVVARFESTLAADTLAEAQRTVSRLHQSLHAEETFRRAAHA